MILAFTGHRPNKLGGGTCSPITDRLQEALEAFLTAKKPAYCMCGGAMGADWFFAQACVKLGIPYDLHIPEHGRTDRWPAVWVDIWAPLEQKASTIYRYCSPVPAVYHLRNKTMVEQCTHLLACWDLGDQGGTAATVAIALGIKRPVFVFSPATGARVVFHLQKWIERARA